MDDKTLFEWVGRDQEIAFEQLFEKYFFRLSHFIFQFVKSEDIAEEIVADVFINLWLKRKTIKISTSFKSYIFVAARNHAINYINKKKKIESTVPIDEVSDNFLSSELMADATLHFRELQKDVNDLINQLPDQQKMIVQLNKIEGFSPVEIAELLNISQKTVYNNLYEAVKFLASNFKKPTD